MILNLLNNIHPSFVVPDENAYQSNDIKKVYIPTYNVGTRLGALIPILQMGMPSKTR